MKRLILLLVLFGGKLLAQTPAAKPVPPPLATRTITGTVKDTEGADVSECILKLKIDDDSLLAIPDASGHFTFENVKSAWFSLTILSFNYRTLVYRYYGDGHAKLITLPVKILKPLYYTNISQAPKNWKVGDKLDAGPDIFRPAMVLAVNDDNTSFKVHYEDGSHPDSWIAGRLTRPYNLQFKADSAAASKGLRPGKYVMYIYHGDVGRYQGYFVINADNTYNTFSANDQESGKGEYSFDKITGIIKWLNGPFSTLDGSAHLSASIDGSAYAIQYLTKDGLNAGFVNDKK